MISFKHWSKTSSAHFVCFEWNIVYWHCFIQNTQNKILIYLTYLAHEYFVDFLNFLKM